MIVKDGEEEGKRIWWWQHLTCAIIKLCCVSCHWNRLSLFCDYPTYKSIIMGLCFYYEAILYFSNLSIILLAFETMKICLLYSPLQLATTQLCFPYAIWIRQWAKNPTSYVWNQSPFIVMLESSYHCGYFSTIPQIYGAHPLYSETSLQSLATVVFSIKGWATSLHNRLQCHPCAKPHQLSWLMHVALTHYTQIIHTGYTIFRTNLKIRFCLLNVHLSSFAIFSLLEKVF